MQPFVHGWQISTTPTISLVLPWGLILSQKSFVTSKVSSVEKLNNSIANMTGQDLPDALVACVGGGSNAIGLFHPFVEDESVAMYGAEAAGLGVDTEHHAATLTKGRPGVLHGSLMDVLQDAHGQILEAFSISAGLDYPGIGPEHSHYHDIKRASYVL